MLGIDISENMIRVVKLRRRGSGFGMAAPLSVPIEAGQANDPVALGKILGRALKQKGWFKQKAIITLPDRLCFVRRLPVDILSRHTGKGGAGLGKATIESIFDLARQSMLVPSAEMILDLWCNREISPAKAPARIRPDDMILIAAARKSAVEFYHELSIACGIKVLSMELRSLAAVNGLLFNWYDTQKENIAVIYLDSGHADIAFFDTQGFSSLHSLNLPSSGNSTETDEAALIEQLPRVFNSLRLSEPASQPQKVFVGGIRAASTDFESLVGRLRKKIGIEFILCRPLTGITMTETQDAGPDVSVFQPALGAALDGLAASPVWFDFMHPRGRMSEKKKSVSWKPFVFVAVTTIILCSAFWLSLVQQKITERNNLMRDFGQMQPSLTEMAGAKKNWSLFRRYLPSSQGGNRLSHIKIINEITSLMPDTKDAYITELTIINSDGAAPATGYNVNITGRISQRDVLAGFIERMNSSEFFQEVKPVGSQPRETTDLQYPIGFTVTCSLTPMAAASIEP